MNQLVTLQIVNWVGCGLSILVVLARIYARVFLVKKAGVDDVFMVMALVCAIATAAMYQVIVEEGIGTSRQTVHAAKLAFMSGIPVLLCQLFGRVSFAFTLLQVMGTTRNRKWFLWFMIVAQFVTNFIALVLSYGICSPLAAFWDPSLKKTSMHCLENYKRIVVDGWQYFETTWDALSDFALALFPILIVRSLQMRKGLKIGLYFLMGLGVFTGLAAIVKCVEYSLLYTYNYSEIDIAIWTVVQEYIVIIAASIPSCRPVFGTSKQSGRYRGGTYEIGSLNRRRFLARRHPQDSSMNQSNYNSGGRIVENQGNHTSRLEASLQTTGSRPCNGKRDSFEHILRPAEDSTQDIRKTTEWRIDYNASNEEV